MRKLIEAKMAKSKVMDAKDVAKILRSSDFGMTEAGGNGEAVAKGGNLIIKDSYWAGGSKKEQSMKGDWSPTGTYSKYFKDEHGVTFKVLKSKVFARDGKMYGKKATAGVVELEVAVVPSAG